MVLSKMGCSTISMTGRPSDAMDTLYVRATVSPTFHPLNAPVVCKVQPVVLTVSLLVTSSQDQDFLRWSKATGHLSMQKCITKRA